MATTPPVQTIELQFDGEDCSYGGPEVVSAGPALIALNNQTEGAVVLTVLKLDEGRTWEEMVDLFPPGAVKEPPPWSTQVNGVRTKAAQARFPGNLEAKEFILDEGLYVISCVQASRPVGVWLGAPFEVKGR